MHACVGACGFEFAGVLAHGRGVYLGPAVVPVVLKDYFVVLSRLKSEQVPVTRAGFRRNVYRLLGGHRRSELEQ